MPLRKQPDYSISVGTDLPNIMTGTDGPQAKLGMGGNDLLFGGRGKDLLMGGDGIDWLFGGRGKDELYGGAGSDLFVYEFVKDGNDRIRDFSPGEDFIRIMPLGGWHAGEDGLSLSPNGKRLYYDKDGEGGKDPFLIAKINVAIDLDYDVLFG